MSEIPTCHDEFGLGAVADIALAENDELHAKVAQLQSDLRAAIDERDRAQVEVARLSAAVAKMAPVFEAYCMGGDS